MQENDMTFWMIFVVMIVGFIVSLLFLESMNFFNRYDEELLRREDAKISYESEYIVDSDLVE